MPIIIITLTIGKTIVKAKFGDDDVGSHLDCNSKRL